MAQKRCRAQCSNIDGYTVAVLAPFCILRHTWLAFITKQREKVVSILAMEINTSLRLWFWIAGG